MHVLVTVTAAAAGQVPAKQLERRQRAVEALASHSREVMEQLRDAEDELLAGGWGAGSRRWLRCARVQAAAQCRASECTAARLLRCGRAYAAGRGLRKGRCWWCLCYTREHRQQWLFGNPLGTQVPRQQHQRQRDPLQLSELGLNSCQLVGLLQGGSPQFLLGQCFDCLLATDVPGLVVRILPSYSQAWTGRKLRRLPTMGGSTRRSSATQSPQGRSAASCCACGACAAAAAPACRRGSRAAVLLQPPQPRSSSRSSMMEIATRVTPGAPPTRPMTAAATTAATTSAGGASAGTGPAATSSRYKTLWPRVYLPAWLLGLQQQQQRQQHWWLS